MAPRNPPLHSDRLEFGQGAEVGAPSKIVDDEALDAHGFGGVDHGNLRRDAGGAHGTYDRILAGQRGGQLLDRVLGPDNWESRREN